MADSEEACFIVSLYCQMSMLVSKSRVNPDLLYLFKKKKVKRLVIGVEVILDEGFIRNIKIAFVIGEQVERHQLNFDFDRPESSHMLSVIQIMFGSSITIVTCALLCSYFDERFFLNNTQGLFHLNSSQIQFTENDDFVIRIFKRKCQ
uniref:Uncharacterized protein n=1 Tax=Romanomermis culicivorax TaxID=13658 RepID=A0A915KMV3_ROMCU